MDVVMSGLPTEIGNEIKSIIKSTKASLRRVLCDYIKELYKYRILDDPESIVILKGVSKVAGDMGNISDAMDYIQFRIQDVEKQYQKCLQEEDGTSYPLLPTPVAVSTTTPTPRQSHDNEETVTNISSESDEVDNNNTGQYDEEDDGEEEYYHRYHSRRFKPYRYHHHQDNEDDDEYSPYHYKKKRFHRRPRRRNRLGEWGEEDNDEDGKRCHPTTSNPRDEAKIAEIRLKMLAAEYKKILELFHAPDEIVSLCRVFAQEAKTLDIATDIVERRKRINQITVLYLKYLHLLYTVGEEKKDPHSNAGYGKKISNAITERFTNLAPSTTSSTTNSLGLGIGLAPGVQSIGVESISVQSIGCITIKDLDGKIQECEQEVKALEHWIYVGWPRLGGGIPDSLGTKGLTAEQLKDDSGPGVAFRAGGGRGGAPPPNGMKAEALYTMQIETTREHIEKFTSSMIKTI